MGVEQPEVLCEYIGVASYAALGHVKGKGKGNYCIAVMEHHATATECHLPYGITQCYLPPDTSERTPPSPQPVRPVLDLPTPQG